LDFVSTWKAFAAGYALAKAVFEFGRARWGVKGRASRVDEVDFTPCHPSLRKDDCPAASRQAECGLKPFRVN